MKQETLTADAKPAGGIGFFEKWLSVWVALCIAAGLALGSLLPGLFEFFAKLEYASVNLVVAVLIWAMVYPMMVNVDFASLRHIGDRPKGLIVTIVVNWLVKPFTMAALGVLFFEVLFKDLIAPADEMPRDGAASARAMEAYRNGALTGSAIDNTITAEVSSK